MPFRRSLAPPSVALWSGADDLHQCSVLSDAPFSRMTAADYQRDRASRLCDLASRASDPEHKRYLLGLGEEAAHQADTLEREAVAKPDDAASDPEERWPDAPRR
jgi:hypothetical protein